MRAKDHPAVRKKTPPPLQPIFAHKQDVQGGGVGVRFARLSHTIAHLHNVMQIIAILFFRYHGGPNDDRTMTLLNHRVQEFQV